MFESIKKLLEKKKFGKIKPLDKAFIDANVTCTIIVRDENGNIKLKKKIK